MTAPGNAVSTMIPVARPWMDEQEADGGAPRDPLRLGHAGARGGRVRARVRRRGRRAARVRRLELHDRTASGACWRWVSAPGDEVITVSHSFIATANAIRYCGAMPVFVDIELATFNIDPALVEAAIGPRTKAILAVHQLGMPCDLASLIAIAARHGVAAHRRRRLRDRQRDRLAGHVGAHRQAARRRRLLLVPSAQAALDRRRRHADDVRTRSSIARSGCCGSTG